MSSRWSRVKPCQVMSSHVKPCQVMSSHVKSTYWRGTNASVHPGLPCVSSHVLQSQANKEERDCRTINMNVYKISRFPVSVIQNNLSWHTYNQSVNPWLFRTSPIHNFMLTIGLPPWTTNFSELSTQLKAPYTSSKCKILEVITKPLACTEIWHSGRFCGVRGVFCTHFGREKMQFWSCPDRPLLQDISTIIVI